MRLAHLYGKTVRGADGVSLGRVHEVRVRAGEVLFLDCGAGSLIERFAARRAGRTVRWENVLRITADEIVLGEAKTAGKARRKRG
jgi:sporulation protein YlmC with PRC-barrel domain